MKINKEKLINKIIKNEEIKDLSKFRRLIKKPLKTLPYFALATIAKIKPYKMKFKTLWGDWMIGDLPNSNTFIYFGYPEANLTNFFIKNLKDGDVFIDGGANIGFYSLLTSNLVGKNGEIHSFEPTPSTFKILNKNLYEKENVEINNYALLHKEKEIDFVDYGLGYNSFNSIINRNSDKIKELRNRNSKIKVKTTTLDTYCKSRNIKPNYIKLDLEGSEYFALLGSIKIIEKYKPIISMEVAGDEEWKKNIKKSNELLINLGYKSYFIKKDGEIIEHELQDKYNYDNLIYKHANN